MTADLTYFCWTCYQPGSGSAERCPHCGGPVHPAADVDYTARLVWALHHPLADRRLLAAQLLGQRGDHAAIEPLRRIVAEAPDPYTTAAALESLVALTGLESNRPLLAHLTARGSVPVRAAARRLLDGSQTTERSSHG